MKNKITIRKQDDDHRKQDNCLVGEQKGQMMTMKLSQESEMIA